VSSKPSVPNLSHAGLWVVNEGGFTFGQGSLSFYDFVEDSMYNNVFLGINERSLGDVFYSISYHRGQAFLVVNNSRKIEVVDSISFESIHTIEGLVSPRKVIGYRDRLFVSDLYSNAITVLDANSYEQIDEIESGGWTESMIVVRDKLYVTVQQTFENNFPGTRKGLLCIDPVELELVEYIPLAQGANSLVLDKVGKIHVLCDGGLDEEPGGIFRLNSLNNEIEVELRFPSVSYSASSLIINDRGDQLYFIMSDPEEGANGYDIMKMPVTTGQLPDIVFIDGGSLYIYGLHIDEERKLLFFNDAVGLLQEGFTYKYSLDERELLETYKTGIFPSQIIVSR
jgi:hypothetical protein